MTRWSFCLASALLLACYQSSELPVSPDGVPLAGVVSERLTLETDDGEADALFGEDAFETFELRLSEKNYAFLDADPTAEQYVEGELVYDGQVYPAGIRYKGSIGAWHRQGQRCVGEGRFTPAPDGPKTCHKLSLKVSFNEYDPEGRFKGLKKVLFHSLNTDPSLMRERLAYEIFRKMGIAAPRASHARLLINGEFWGVYAFIEYIDGRFTRSRWSSGEGNLYKELWPRVDDRFRENTEQLLQTGLRTNEDEQPSFDGFVGFETAMKAAGNDDERLAVLRKWVDVDYMLRYLAADRAAAHDDGVLHFYPTGETWYNHNFYWYEALDHDRLWLIPWDMDTAWSPANLITDIKTAWNDREAGCTSIAGGFGIPQLPPACHPIVRALADPSLHAAFVGHVEELLDEHLAEDVINARITKWSALIADSVAESADAFEGEPSVEDWQAGKVALKQAIEQTRSELRAMIGPR